MAYSAVRFPWTDVPRLPFRYSSLIEHLGGRCHTPGRGRIKVTSLDSGGSNPSDQSPSTFMLLMCRTSQWVIPMDVFKTTLRQLVMGCTNSNTTSGLRLSATGFRDITQLTPRDSL